jgi:hypothetical protein
MKKDGQQAVRAGSGEKARELLMGRIEGGGQQRTTNTKKGRLCILEQASWELLSKCR